MAKHQIASWSHGPATRNSCASTSGLFKSTTNSAFQVPELRITKKRNVVHARAPYQPATLFFYRFIVLAAGGRHMVRKPLCFEAFFLRVAVFAFSVLFLCLLSVVRPSPGSKFLFGRCAVQRPKKPSILAIFFLSVVFMRAFLCGLFWMLRIFFGLFFLGFVCFWLQSDVTTRFGTCFTHCKRRGSMHFPSRLSRGLGWVGGWGGG